MNGPMRDALTLGVAALTLLWAGASVAQAPAEQPAAAANSAPDQVAEFDEEAPDEDWVWVDGDDLEDGTAVKGFYRIRARPNYVWVEGTMTDGVWIAPHWRWTGEARAAHVHVRGHRGPDGYWVRGYWRPETRAGHRWVVHTRAGGVRVHGHWAPVDLRPDHVWVPGHWSRRGNWVPGHWRVAKRIGYVWVPSQWRYRRFVAGH